MRSPAIPDDTSADAHEIQRRIYARMGGAGRLAIAFELSDSARRLTQDGIRHRHPRYTDEQVFLAWARLTLGDALVQKVWPDRRLVDP